MLTLINIDAEKYVKWREISHVLQFTVSVRSYDLLPNLNSISKSTRVWRCCNTFAHDAIQ